MKKILAIILTTIIGVTGLVGCGNSKTEDTQNKTEVNNQEQKDIKQCKLGEEFKVGDIGFIVEKVETTDQDKYETLDAGKDLFVVTVKVENNSDKDFEFNPNYFSLEGPDGDIMKSDKTPKDSELKPLRLTTLKNGEDIDGTINFEINKDEKINKINFTYKDTKEVINITK